jgi:opacity protein-like surface antigen
VVLAVTVIPSTAHAQTARSESVASAPALPSIEEMPYVSIDSRGMIPIGAAVSFPLNSTFSIETEVDYRRAEGHLNALSSSANLLYNLPTIGRVTPYLAAGAGIAQYGSPIISPRGGIIGTQSAIAFEVNAGGGLKVPVDDSLDFRTDARWYKSFGRNSSDHWRISNGVSFDVGKR